MLTDEDKRQIRVKVRQAIADQTGIEAGSIKDEHTLFPDLKMTPEDKEELAGPFTQIARRYRADASVTESACGALTTVAAAKQLVIDAAESQPS